jgi:hypothetical protein
MMKKLLLRFHDILKIKFLKSYWIPSLVCIRGNEKVDALAKQSLMLPACDFRTAISKLVSSEWKANWDNAV